MERPSAELLAEWNRGGETAAGELFRRYIARLTALARSKISPRLGRRLDAEDVALSAYRSFFVRARRGQVRLEHSGDLWHLLAAIAVNKLHRQVLHHRAMKRSIDHEQPLPPDAVAPIATDPRGLTAATAEEAASVADEFERFVSLLSPAEREILELRMQDLSQREIATRVGKSERTVRRMLTDLQRRLEQGLLESEETPAATVPLVEAGNAPAPVGHWLSDSDFRLTRHLGTGGSGKVYEALWNSAGEWVAVKMLKKRIQSDREAVERFVREAVTVSRLQHPGIVPVRGIGKLRSGGYFLVLEYLPGGDLSAVMHDRQIEVAEALRWVAQAAEAIDFAHRHGVIHCDLKPSNLLLDSQGTVRVTDFGLAHVRGHHSKHSLPGGTLGFMAPEQLDPSYGDVGPQTDVFGLGAMLFALLTGKPPFIAETWEQTIDELLHAPAPSLRAVRPEISESVEAICQRCLSRRIEERFTSAAELAENLHVIVVGVGSPLCPSSARERT